MSRTFLGFAIVCLLSHLLRYSSIPAEIRSSCFGKTAAWNSPATWNLGRIPAPDDDVVISAGDTVTFDVPLSTTISSLSIAGVLQYENTLSTSHVRQLIVTGNLSVQGTFRHGLGTTSSEQDITVGGDLMFSSGSVLDLGTGSSKGIIMTLNGPSGTTQTIGSDGLPNSITFQKIVVDRPNPTDHILCSINVSVKGGNEALRILKGIWEQNAGLFTHTASSSSGTNWWFGTPEGTLSLSGSGSARFSASITGASGSNGFTGRLLLNTTGSLSVGANSGAGRLQVNGTLLVEAGTIYIWGRFTNSAGTTTIAGGSIIIDPQMDSTHTLGATSHPFEIQSSSHFSMSGGTIMLVDPLVTSGTGREIKISSAAIVDFSGGEVRLGNGTSTASGGDGFEIDVAASSGLWNLTVDGGESLSRKSILMNDLTLRGSLTLASGILDADTHNLTLHQPVAGTTSNLRMNSASSLSIAGTASGITLPSSVTHLARLTVDNPEGTTLSSALTVHDELRLSGGPLILHENNLRVHRVVEPATPGKCIVTDGLGTVTSLAIPGDTVCFPVAHDRACCNPVSIVLESTDPPDSFSVRVGTTIAPAIPNEQSVVHCAWSIHESVQGGNHALMTFGWSAPDEGGNFARWSAGVWSLQDGAWIHAATGVTSGLDPFVLSTTQPLDAFSLFVVGNDSALPVQVNSFATLFLDANKLKLLWSTASEVNNYGFEVQKSSQQSAGFTSVSGIIPGHHTTTVPHEYSYIDSSYGVDRRFYRLRQIDLDGSEWFVGPLEITPALSVPMLNPLHYALFQNFPNPFNAQTTIGFTLDRPERVRLILFDILGRETAVLFNGLADAGTTYLVRVDGSRLSTGTYFYRLETRFRTETRSMLLLR